MQNIYDEIEEFFYDDKEVKLDENEGIIFLDLVHPDTEIYTDIMYQIELFFNGTLYNIEDYIIEGDFESNITIEKGI